MARVVGLIDADLLDRGTTHPNLALMKISAYEKAAGSQVRLLNYGHLSPVVTLFGTLPDAVFLSKVFTRTAVPEGVLRLKNMTVGGTGFFGHEAPDLPPEIENHYPDYHLYDEYVARLGHGQREELTRRNYTRYSIGFMTRGCFRKCSFCVVRRYKRARRASSLSSFLALDRPWIRLWDDNVLAYKGWDRVLEELNASGKPFVFQQGLDIRLLTEKKARALHQSNYLAHGFIFAFDNLDDRERIEPGLKLWARYSPFDRMRYHAKVYVLVAYDPGWAGVLSAFTRIEILMRLGYLPYIMRFDGWEQTEHRDLYVALAAWCNQPHRFLKHSFRGFVEEFGERSLGRSVRQRVLDLMTTTHDLVPFLDLRYEDFHGSV